MTIGTPTVSARLRHGGEGDRRAEPDADLQGHLQRAGDRGMVVAVEEAKNVRVPAAGSLSGDDGGKRGEHAERKEHATDDSDGVAVACRWPGIGCSPCRPNLSRDHAGLGATSGASASRSPPATAS